MDCKEINQNCYKKPTLQDSAFINRISERQATFFGHVKRREKVQNLVTTGMIVPKQHQKMLDGLSK